MKLMRTLLMALFVLALSEITQAQQSYGIAYQAVVRDGAGNALENATLDVRFTLTDASDQSVWTETHSTVVTDDFGLMNLEIGGAAGSSGLLAVDWAAGGYAFDVEVNSGSGYESFGNIQVTAVPVALFALNGNEDAIDALASDLAQEVSDRASGDSGLQGQLDVATGDIATNASSASANAASASTNAGEIASVLGMVQSNDGELLSLTSSLADLSALVDDNDHFDLDGGNLSTEDGITSLTVGGTLNATNVIASNGTFTGYVLSTLAPVSGDHMTNKSYVDGKVDAEQLRAETAESFMTSDIATLAIASAAVPGQFNEVNTRIDDVEGDLSDETTRATAAEGANASAIAAETLRATAAEGANADAISDETSRAGLAEGANATAISDETSRATAAEGANATAISDETSRAGLAEGANATAISDETSRAGLAEGANATAISDETSRAALAEGANATAI
ncbi:MAG: hypothetical protein P8M07_07715, partial [Flavobacteriales bacterium]|nr:hypothetical protein [Flavobacteriales bacterium]